MPDPVAARMTPAGRGGVAVISVADGLSQVATVFSKPIQQGLLIHGHITVAGENVDEVLVLHRGRVGEIHAHGGPVGGDRILTALEKQGVRRTDSREILVREGLTPGQVEAVGLLQKTRTLLAVQVLSEPLIKGKMKRPAPARLRRALIHPMTVVLVGRPNVGKSTLFNSLVEQDRAIVSPEPGTTRDPVREMISLEGVPVWLVDTAGIMESEDALNRAAVERSRREVARADLVVHVREAHEKPHGFSVVNKCDLRRGRGLNVSGKTGEGLDRLRKALLRHLPLGPLPWVDFDPIKITPG